LEIARPIRLAYSSVGEDFGFGEGFGWARDIVAPSTNHARVAAGRDSVLSKPLQSTTQDLRLQRQQAQAKGGAESMMMSTAKLRLMHATRSVIARRLQR
jgi:hypothetical protein